MVTRLSLLDRLLDDFPEEQNPRDPDVAADERRRGTWDNWREGLRRDLSMLLTARASAGAAGSAGARVAESVARYGVALSSSGGGRTGGPEAVLAAVAAFEPRFREPWLMPRTPKDDASLVCAIGGWVEWDGRRKELVVKVVSEGDGWKVDLYE